MIDAERLFSQFSRYYDRRHHLVAEVAGTRYEIVSNGCAIVAERTDADLVACTTTGLLLPEALRILGAATRVSAVDVPPLRAWLAQVAPTRTARVVIPCDKCKGGGEVRCPRCNGEGVKPCPTCLRDEPCGKCGGSGDVACGCGNSPDVDVDVVNTAWRGQTWNGAALAAALDLLGGERVEVAQSGHPLDACVLRSGDRWVALLPMNAPAKVFYAEVA